MDTLIEWMRYAAWFLVGLALLSVVIDAYRLWMSGRENLPVLDERIDE